MNENTNNLHKNKQWKILDWDSSFFGFPVAQITEENLSEKEFKNIMDKIKTEGVKLIYWSFPEDNKEAEKLATKYKGELVDNKVTFIQSLENFQPIKEGAISEYQKDTPEEKLINIAIQSGIYSRFNKDKKIGKAKFEALYKLWITNSVNKKNADIVLVSTHDNEISGFVTVKKNGNNSIIGLIAVDTEHRGKKIGTSLINTALTWAKEQGCKTAQVGTQKENIAACRLYEKCGYQIKSIEKFYHFWLK